MHKQGKRAVHEKISNRRTSDHACVAKSFRTIDKNMQTLLSLEPSDSENWIRWLFYRTNCLVRDKKRRFYHSRLWQLWLNEIWWQCVDHINGLWDVQYEQMLPLYERPECDGLLLHGKFCERYKVMILSHQTDRLERDHKVLIFRRVK